MGNKLIDHNPMLKKPALALLGFCVEHDGASRATIEGAAAQAWPASYNQSVSSVLDALVRADCLCEQITVNGNPYDGTLEDVYRDESVALDANVDALITVTEDGQRVIDEYKPEATLASLLADKPAYQNVFTAALRACADEIGANRESLEQTIEIAIQDGAVRAADGGRIYPQYFIDALETAGGIEWDGAWSLTPAGAAVIPS